MAVGVSPRWSWVLWLALLLAPAPARAGTGRTVYLWFADGQALPPQARGVCTDAPPPFQCSYGANREECRDQVWRLLDRWYADFDVVFSYTPPEAGVFDTVVVTSNGRWCGLDDQIVSRGPSPICLDRGGQPGTAVTIFQCGDDPRKCATLIAKEQAHVVGLQHTVSLTDVMNDYYSPDHDGFEDRDNMATSLQCGRLQNSYRVMLERLGPWSGGPKPSPGPAPPVPLPGLPDAGPPAADSGPVADAGAPAGGGGGCEVAGQASGPGGAMALAAVLLGLRWSRRRRVSASRDRAKRGNPAVPTTVSCGGG
jgi:MYXO-CTERM domain-containing protein